MNFSLCLAISYPVSSGKAQLLRSLVPFLEQGPQFPHQGGLLRKTVSLRTVRDEYNRGPRQTYGVCKTLAHVAPSRYLSWPPTLQTRKPRFRAFATVAQMAHGRAKTYSLFFQPQTCSLSTSWYYPVTFAEGPVEA